MTTTLTIPPRWWASMPWRSHRSKGLQCRLHPRRNCPRRWLGGTLPCCQLGGGSTSLARPRVRKNFVMLPKKTMANLGKTLAWLKATKADVVQVKAFLRPFGDFREVVEEVAAFFPGMSAPTCVFVEWSNASLPAEIEMIVAGGPAGEKTPDGVAFLTPPGLSPSPRFARIAVVDPDHPLIFISGLYAETTGSGRREWLEIFGGELVYILGETGSSMRHQVKGTYYFFSQHVQVAPVARRNP